MTSDWTRRGFLLTAGGVAVAAGMPVPVLAREGAVAGFPFAVDYLASDHLETQPLGGYVAGAVLYVPRLRKLYIGTTSSHRTRQSLAAVPLDATGAPVGRARWYADHPDPLDRTTVDAKSKVTALAWHEDHPDRLYVGLTVFGLPDFTTTLACYRLDRDGWPAETLAVYDVGSHKSEALRFHPSGRSLYLLRDAATPHLLVYDVTSSGDLAGTPTGVTVLGDRKLGAEVHPDGSPLYVFSYTRQVVTLPVERATGRPSGDAGVPVSLYKGAKSEYFSFAVTPRAIFVKSPGQTLDRLPLDESGIPDQPVVATNEPVVAVAGTTSPRHIVVAANRTFTDALDSQEKVDGTLVRIARIAADGSLDTIEETALDRQSADICLRPQPAWKVTKLSGSPGIGLLTVHLGTGSLGFKGYRARGLRVRARLLDAPLRICKGQFHVPRYDQDKRAWSVEKTPQPPVEMVGGPESAWLEWVDLDDRWQDHNELLGIQLVLTDPSHPNDPLTGRAVVEFELEREVDGTVTTLRRRVPIEGSHAGLVVPANGHAKATEDLADSVRESPAYYAEHRRWARAVQVPRRERPSQYLFINSVLAFEARLDSVRTGLDTVAMLGTNTGYVTGGTMGLPAQEIRRAAERAGIGRFRLQLFLSTFRKPPESGIFQWQFDGERWLSAVQQQAMDLYDLPLSEIALLQMQDEPGFAFPDVISQLGADGLAEFRAFLETASGLQPKDFGYPSWAKAEPVNPASVGNTPTPDIRRRHLWTQRFFTDSFSRALKQATGLVTPVSPAILATTNLQHGGIVLGYGNGWMNLLGPGGKKAYPDPFHLARVRGVSCLWTETWTSDAWAQHLSFQFDLLRSAARTAAEDGGGPLPFGAYLTGGGTGAFEGGAAYQMFALVGRGAKALENYMYGPKAQFRDGWSDSQHFYQHFADAARLLGRAEHVLYPGKPRAGTVALWYPQASQYWDTYEPSQPKHQIYKYEIEGLHFACTHAQLPVDLLDDTGLETGPLEQYSVLYLTGPNLSVRGQQAVLAWVRRGGTAVLLPGACTADEYNEPTTLFAQARGAQVDPVERTLSYAPGHVPHWAVSQSITRTTEGAQAPFAFPVAATSTTFPATPLTKGPTETVLAVDKDGSPAVVAMPYGSGRLISYGYWPGTSYLYSPVWPQVKGTGWPPPQRLPWGWDDNCRAVATWPAELAGARRHVTSSQPGVEPLLLESDAGIGITLLNWFGEPLDDLTLTVPGYIGRRPRVESCRGTRLRHTLTADGLTITLALNNVDVVTITEPT